MCDRLATITADINDGQGRMAYAGLDMQTALSVITPETAIQNGPAIIALLKQATECLDQVSELAKGEPQ